MAANINGSIWNRNSKGNEEGQTTKIDFTELVKRGVPNYAVDDGAIL